ncbi:MAG TPA: endolytic transglycosylase MltG [Microbacteriaceae bacterium]|nr:endolytic transglycosylase MltG [Microbacteriaceae bacterium]
MAKDGGWEDLFSPLNDDEAMPPLLGETGSVPTLFPDLPDPVLEATPLDPAAPSPSVAEPEPPAPPATPATPATPAEPEPPAPAAPDAPAGPVAPSGDAVATGGLTRRELRERRAAAAATGSVESVAQPATEPFTPVFETPTDPEPEAAAWDPAPELEPEPTRPPVVDAPTIPVSYDAVPPTAGGGGGEPPRQGPGGGFPIPLDPPPPAKRRIGLRWLAWFIPVVLVLGGLTAGAVYAWQNHEDQVRELLGMEIPNDYDGTGNGEEVIVTINQGDTGTVIARKLHDAGVTMTWDAFYNLLLELANSGGEPTIQFGNFRLEKEMSAQAALSALLDPANKITNNLYIPEGIYLFQVLDIISTTLDVPIEEVQAAAADPAQYGAANPAGTLEGYLAPDTYHLDGTEDVTSILQRLVDATFARLDALGVAPEDRHRILTMASVVQRESGPAAGDPAKVARVFYNRLDQDMLWQSDATVSYGAGNFTSIWNTSAMLDDPSNPYNTYVHKGYPLGPIAAPSELAIEAAVAPAEGPWLFFVPVNLRTGETHFSETADEHEAYVDVLREWCNASDENASYCR